MMEKTLSEKAIIYYKEHKAWGWECPVYNCGLKGAISIDPPGEYNQTCISFLMHYVTHLDFIPLGSERPYK